MLMPFAGVFANEIMTRESVKSDDPFLTCLIVECRPMLTTTWPAWEFAED